MKTINFEERSEQLEIAGKVYSVCVSNYDFIKKVQASMADLEVAQKKLKDDNGIEDIMEALKQVINLALDDFDRIWKEANHDIYDMIDVCLAIAEIIQKGFEYKARKYV
jgi:hypothetical protein